VARAFGASVTPEAFLFSSDGKLAYHGTIDDNRADPDKVVAHNLGDALAAVAAEDGLQRGPFVRGQNRDVHG
jgi:hypothetical protein